ncbi:MAG: protealysin inhibitor emfourin [Kovacikia sp.]
MRISFERSGGFAGISLTTTVDTATLTPAEGSQLRQVVEVADFFLLPAEIPSPAQPDRFQYRLTVEEGNRHHTVTMGESAVPGTLRPLLDWLLNAARQRDDR